MNCLYYFDFDWRPSVVVMKPWNLIPYNFFLLLLLLHHDSPHLPHGHVPVVGVSVVVPLDREQVGVKREEGRRHEALIFGSPQAWRDRYVAHFIKYLKWLVQGSELHLTVMQGHSYLM